MSSARCANTGFSSSVAGGSRSGCQEHFISFSGPFVVVSPFRARRFPARDSRPPLAATRPRCPAADRRHRHRLGGTSCRTYTTTYYRHHNPPTPMLGWCCASSQAPAPPPHSAVVLLHNSSRPVGSSLWRRNNNSRSLTTNNVVSHQPADGPGKVAFSAVGPVRQCSRRFSATAEPPPPLLLEQPSFSVVISTSQTSVNPMPVLLVIGMSVPKNQQRLR